MHSTVERFLDHFDHVKKLAGVEHPGVGSDIDLIESASGEGKRVLAQIWPV